MEQWLPPAGFVGLAAEGHSGGIFCLSFRDESLCAGHESRAGAQGAAVSVLYLSVEDTIRGYTGKQVHRYTGELVYV